MILPVLCLRSKHNTGRIMICKEHPPRWEEFLKTLTERLSKTTPSLPCVRCLTKKTLARMFREIQIELKLPSTYPSGVKILEHLISMGLATRVPIEDAPKLTPSKEFFLLGIRGSRELDVDPLELLQAYHQSGIICYFSALAHLNLTTQISAHHHVAILTPRSIKTNIEPAEIIPKSDNSKEKIKRSRLGTPAFSYQGIPYYSVKRVKNSLPGVKIRILSPWTRIRMTTIEQTLLDTLQYPFHCGGPEAVFEAWEKQIEKIDDDLILDYLERIQIAPLTRRIGAIFELLGHHPVKRLDSFLKKKRNQFFAQSEIQHISLLRGTHYSQINSSWYVYVP